MGGREGGRERGREGGREAKLGPRLTLTAFPLKTLTAFPLKPLLAAAPQVDPQAPKTSPPSEVHPQPLRYTQTLAPPRLTTRPSTVTRYASRRVRDDGSQPTQPCWGAPPPLASPHTSSRAAVQAVSDGPSSAPCIIMRWYASRDREAGSACRQGQEGGVGFRV